MVSIAFTNIYCPSSHSLSLSHWSLDLSMNKVISDKDIQYEAVNEFQSACKQVHRAWRWSQPLVFLLPMNIHDHCIVSTPIYIIFIIIVSQKDVNIILHSHHAFTLATEQWGQCWEGCCHMQWGVQKIYRMGNISNQGRHDQFQVAVSAKSSLLARATVCLAWMNVV